jgi:hypothetical protein
MFLDENVPSKQDSACVILNVDKVTNLLSSPDCPIEAMAEGSFFLPKSELPNRWPTWEAAVQKWATEQMVLWTAGENHSGSLLPLPLAPTKECDPALTPGRNTKPELRIIFPKTGDVVDHPVFRIDLSITSLSPVREVRYEMDGKPIGTYTEAPFNNRPVRVLRRIDKEGSHMLTVTMTDTYYNTVSDSVEIRFAE